MPQERQQSNVIDLVSFRRRKRIHYLAKFSRTYDKFLQIAIETHFKTDMDEISSLYKKHHLSQNEAAWDFYDLREVINEAITDVYGPMIWDLINREKWFDPALIKFEEVMDRCTSILILGDDLLPPKFTEQL